jgi:hypothetical protein
MQALIKAALATVVLALAGCASSIDAQVKAEIKTIALEPVKLTDKPVVAGPGTGVLALATGGLGLAGQQGLSGDIREAYKTIVERQVNVAAEIRSTAKTELERKGYRVVEAGQPSDARLTISGNYALGLASLTGDERGAGTTLTAELVRSADGRSIYRKTGLGTNGDPALKSKLRLAPYEQWFKDEALVAEQHKLVAGLVAAEVLQGL